MKRSLCFLIWLYSHALRLYPRAHQVEYGSEMVWVFEQAVERASQLGATALLWLAARELWTLPGANVSEHQRARRKRAMIERAHSVHEEGVLRSGGGSWREVLAALAPFVLLGIVPSLLGMTPLSGQPGVVVGIVVLGE